MQQIGITRNLDRADGSTVSFITKEAKERVLDFSKWAVKVLWFYSALW